MPIQSQFGIGGLGGGNSTLGMLQRLGASRDALSDGENAISKARTGVVVNQFANDIGQIPLVGGILGGLTRSGFALSEALSADPNTLGGTAAPPTQTDTSATGTPDALAFLSELRDQEKLRKKQESLEQLQQLSQISGTVTNAVGGGVQAYLGSQGGQTNNQPGGAGTPITPKVGASSRLDLNPRSIQG